MAMPDKFLKPYDPQAVESGIYKEWEESGYFNPDNLPGERTQPYTIIMPPPNANGSLHVGHGLVVTIQDILIRFKRMQGFKTLWLPGADHAGFETQIVYEKKLEKEGRSRFKMDPKDLYKEIYDFTIANKSYMENQLRQLGASCDWSREKFTLDPDVVAEVQRTFVKMHKDGLVYRRMRPVNWCTKHQTSLSDVETTPVERVDPLYYMKYGPFTLATVRPETKFGDTAVAVNPNDPRYKEWVGKEIEFESLLGPVKLKVIADEFVDPEFGTGVVKVTPAHDPNDFDMGLRHNLPAVEVIDRYGKLNDKTGKYAGLKIAEARAQVAKDLADKGLLEKVDEEYKHVVKTCFKCGTVMEPRLMDQWFVKMQPLAKMALEAVEGKKVVFVPDNFRKIFTYWMENTLDWNISRQIVWGIPIPAWQKNGEWQAGLESPGNGWVRDPDTFDTWFSSGQWPLLTLGYPDGKDFKTYYPTQVMESGYDLVFKWIPRMVIFGLYLAKKEPFSTVYFHGLVNDAQGKKMSKSKGNVINPLDMGGRYGTDAMRMALVVGNTPGQDSALSENKIKAYKLFANKIWNIARFTLSQERTGEIKPELKEEFDAMAKDITKDLEEYRIYMAAEKLYHYLWGRFAAEIIEESKGKPEYSATLYYILENSLKLLHPFMPFVTEEIWKDIPARKDLLMVEEWPIKSVL